MLATGGAILMLTGLANLVFRSDEEIAYELFAAARALTIVPIPGGAQVGLQGNF